MMVVGVDGNEAGGKARVFIWHLLRYESTEFRYGSNKCVDHQILPVCFVDRYAITALASLPIYQLTSDCKSRLPVLSLDDLNIVWT